jgi:hypothetical protein
MGDICDMNDLERFSRSPEGQACLAETRLLLEGRTIQRVTFSNEVNYIATTLELDNGEFFFISQPSLEVGAIREDFEEVLEREHDLEYRQFEEEKIAKCQTAVS